MLSLNIIREDDNEDSGGAMKQDKFEMLIWMGTLISNTLIHTYDVNHIHILGPGFVSMTV